VTRSADGIQADGSSYHTSVSPDGRHVAFNSCATNLVPDGRTHPADTDVFIKDLHTGAVERVTGGTDGYDYSAQPALSSDGLLLAFLTTERLVDADRNDSPDIYVHETGRSTAYPDPVYRYNLRPTALSFGEVKLGSSSKKGFTLVNTGEAPLPIEELRIAGLNRGAYALRSFCGVVVAPGGHCWIAVTFKPTVPGLAAASLHVQAGGIDRYRALRGTGVR
jgi:dipeptidyl aminopeptidase/acylaminoacyl peptidase